MKFGITFDLRSWYTDRGYSMEETAEFDKQDTIDAIAGVLQEMGHTAELTGNVFQLVEALAAGKRWDMVFNIAEGLYGDGRESTIPALLDQYRIPYVFSSPAVMSIALNKHLAKLVAASHGIPTGKGCIAASAADIAKIDLPFPLFVKPLYEGTGKGITQGSLVKNKTELETQALSIIHRFRQPAIVEEYLPGREFTVGIIGHGDKAVAIGGMEITTGGNQPYSVYMKENYLDNCKYTPLPGDIAAECKTVALQAWKALNAVDGGRIDLKTDSRGQICFLEANPLAGIHPVHSDLPILARMSGIDYQQLLNMIVDAATERNKKAERLRAH
ncbi:MAG: hypothetical protein LBV26_00585 [Bacteroidales bacterium]|jgi:D-alanine-D-alanine ligase|nr:hypothetical protein [Bacteroidales bacterium]